jgi:hypothetical protein
MLTTHSYFAWVDVSDEEVKRHLHVVEDLVAEEVLGGLRCHPWEDLRDQLTLPALLVIVVEVEVPEHCVEANQHEPWDYSVGIALLHLVVVSVNLVVITDQSEDFDCELEALNLVEVDRYEKLDDLILPRVSINHERIPSHKAILNLPVCMLDEPPSLFPNPHRDEIDF